VKPLDLLDAREGKRYLLSAPAESPLQLGCQGAMVFHRRATVSVPRAYVNPFTTGIRSRRRPAAGRRRQGRAIPSRGSAVTTSLGSNGERPRSVAWALAGMRVHRVLMHNGRAPTPWEDIQMHGGQAAASRDAFNPLPELATYAPVAFFRTR
jgi:hypothetical protein